MSVLPPSFLKKRDRNSVKYSPPLDLILSQSNPVYKLTLYFFNIYFNIILPCAGFLSSLFPSDLFVLASSVTLKRADGPKQAIMKNVVFCGVTSCGLVVIYFPSTLKMEVVHSSLINLCYSTQGHPKPVSLTLLSCFTLLRLLTSTNPL